MSGAASIAASTPSNYGSNKRTREERDEDEGSGEQPQQSSAPVSPVTRLYRHALESIFAFLSLADLSRVSSVSRSWFGAVRSMASIGAAVTRSTARPSVIAASGLVSHVSQFGALGFSSHSLLDSTELFVLSRSFGSLTALGCSIVMPPSAPLVFSHKLRQVWIELLGVRAAPELIPEVITTLIHLPVLVGLAFRFAAFLPELSFSPLLGAASLRALRLDPAFTSQPSAEQIDQLRLLGHLQTMAISKLISASLCSLLRTPHQLQWQQIHRVRSVDEIASAALSSLQSLTCLEADACSSLAFLPSLTRLRDLELRVDSSVALPASMVAAGLASCTELSTLLLTAPVTSVEMRVILDSLPLLTDLTLHGCRIHSVAFFREVDWSRRIALRRLTISHSTSQLWLPVECPHLPACAVSLLCRSTTHSPARCRSRLCVCCSLLSSCFRCSRPSITITKDFDLHSADRTTGHERQAVGAHPAFSLRSVDKPLHKPVVHVQLISAAVLTRLVNSLQLQLIVRSMCEFELQLAIAHARAGPARRGPLDSRAALAAATLRGHEA